MFSSVFNGLDSLHKPQCLSVYLPSYTYWVLLITRKLGGALNRVPADKSIQEMLQVFYDFPWKWIPNQIGREVLSSNNNVEVHCARAVGELSIYREDTTRFIFFYPSRSERRWAASVPARTPNVKYTQNVINGILSLLSSPGRVTIDEPSVRALALSHLVLSSFLIS